MRKCFLVGLLLLSPVLVAHCQPGPSRPGQTGPPVGVSPDPLRPAAPAPMTPPPPVAIPAPSPAPDYVDTIPELAFLLSLPRLLGRPLTFLAVFLFIGLVFTRLARRIIVPKLSEAQYGNAPDARVTRQLAISSLVVWGVALFAACEAVGVKWFETLIQVLMNLLTSVFGLLGATIGGLLWVVAAAVIAYAISPRGRDFVLGVMGWYYLRWHPSKPAADREFDLGGGLRGRIVSSDFLHSVLQTADGQQHTLPNAWLMKTHFNWDREAPGTPVSPMPPSSPA